VGGKVRGFLGGGKMEKKGIFLGGGEGRRGKK